MKELKRLLQMFCPRREERLPSAVLLIWLFALHYWCIRGYWPAFSLESLSDAGVFYRDFHISGFDPISYGVATKWYPTYDVYRHPLLAFFVYPLYLVNHFLLWLTGRNLVQLVFALPLLLCAYYTYIFLYRIMRELIGLRRTDATLLALLHFTLAYVMVSLIVPDHFAPSMCLLVWAIYLSGRYMQAGRRMTVLQTVVLFTITAGITLSNGIKIFIDTLFTNKWRFFSLRFILPAVIVPSALMWGIACWEYQHYTRPKEELRQAAQRKAAKTARQKAFQAFRDTTQLTDTAEIKKTFSKSYQLLQRQEARKRWQSLHRGEAIKGKSKFLRWTDITTPRWPSLVENVCGESVQLHRDNLLGDTQNGRPIIVTYRWWGNYAIEILILLLCVAGVCCGVRSRLLWMVLAGFAFDMALHLGLGFGLNEVYIMSPHWLFVVPLTMAFLVRRLPMRWLLPMRALLVLTTLWLLVWNGSLLIGYLCV